MKFRIVSIIIMIIFLLPFSQLRSQIKSLENFFEILDFIKPSKNDTVFVFILYQSNCISCLNIIQHEYKCLEANYHNKVAVIAVADRKREVEEFLKEKNISLNIYHINQKKLSYSIESSAILFKLDYIGKILNEYYCSDFNIFSFCDEYVK